MLLARHRLDLDSILLHGENMEKEYKKLVGIKLEVEQHHQRNNIRNINKWPEQIAYSRQVGIFVYLIYGKRRQGRTAQPSPERERER